MSQSAPDTLTASESARLLGISEAYIRKLIKAGELSATKNGRTWCIHREDIERLRTESHFNRTAESNGFAPDDIERITEFEVIKERLAAKEQENTRLQEQMQQTHTQLEYFQTQNDHLTQLLAVAQKSVQQVTEQNQLLLEDNRKQRASFWSRLKARWTR